MPDVSLQACSTSAPDVGTGSDVRERCLCPVPDVQRHSHSRQQGQARQLHPAPPAPQQLGCCPTPAFYHATPPNPALGAASWLAHSSTHPQKHHSSLLSTPHCSPLSNISYWPAKQQRPPIPLMSAARHPEHSQSDCSTSTRWSCRIGWNRSFSHNTSNMEGEHTAGQAGAKAFRQARPNSEDMFECV